MCALAMHLTAPLCTQERTMQRRDPEQCPLPFTQRLITACHVSLPNSKPSAQPTSKEYYYNGSNVLVSTAKETSPS